MVYDDLMIKKGMIKWKMKILKRREIKKIWTVNEQKISHIHTAGPVLAPGIGKIMIRFYY